jgi:cytochrome oxidase assembly protein ShyY1
MRRRFKFAVIFMVVIFIIALALLTWQVLAPALVC